jgi:hypothetical protein
MAADCYGNLLSIIKELVLIPPTSSIGGPIWQTLDQLAQKMNAEFKGSLNIELVE